MSLIEIDEVTKVFGTTRAVDGVTFAAPSGTVTGFLGPNGAGKTTTPDPARPRATRRRRCADRRARVRRPSFPATHGRSGARLTGFHPGRTGRNHLRVLSRAAGIPRGRVAEVLEFVALEEAADRRVGGYSYACGSAWPLPERC